MRLIDDLVQRPAYALIRLRGAATVTVLGGETQDLERIADIPLADGPPADGRRFDRLVCVPFRQIAERGFAAHDDGTPLRAIEIDAEAEVPLEEILGELPDLDVRSGGDGGFDIDDGAYGDVVASVIRHEIGAGEGANLVIGRTFRTQLLDWEHRAALSVFRRLLERERGAYWTFCVFTGDRWLIGASPERHVSVQAGEVRMNPISGTFRLRGHVDAVERKDALLRFLADDKEIFELFMVVDEELKMMCDICSEGGQILGPYLKPMTHLVHTEYLLAGRSHRDTREILRDSMFAATVTGSPVENACRLIERYEPKGRGYYGSVLALFGRDRSGGPTLDAPILIRTGDVSLGGELTVTAGATLVRDSDPAYEVAETHAKAAGILAAFGLVAGSDVPRQGVRELSVDEDVLIALGSRNQRLSRFWMTDQGGAVAVPSLRGRRVVIVDGEDDFVNMLTHVLRVLGLEVTVVAHASIGAGALPEADLVVVGPGPGDPRDRAHPKMAALRDVTERLLDSDRPFLAVCLGHQILCDLLGIPLVLKDIVFQGTQTTIEVLGRREDVGFYNTFVARVGEGTSLPTGVTVDSDPVTGDVHLVRGPRFRGVQFHPESILTENGYAIVRDLLTELLD